VEGLARREGLELRLQRLGGGTTDDDRACGSRRSWAKF